MSLLRSLTFVQFLDTVVDLSVVVRVVGCWQKTVGVPQLQSDTRRGADRAIMPRIMEDILIVFSPLVCDGDVLKTAESPQLQFIDEVGFTCSWLCSDWCLMLRAALGFLGALDGQQLLVVEGSGVPGSPGVYSQVTRAPSTNHQHRATITTTTTRARTLKVAHSSGVAYRVCLLRSPWMVNATCAARALPDAAGSDGCAACRAAEPLVMAFAEQLHHSVNRVERDEVLWRQTTRASGEGEVHEKHDGPPGTEATSPREAAGGSEPQAGIMRHTGVGYERVLNAVVPQMAEPLVEVLTVACGYISPAPALFLVISQWWTLTHTFLQWFHHLFQWWSILHPHQQFLAPVHFVEYLAPAPAVSESSAPVVERSSTAPAVFISPASSGGVHRAHALAPAPAIVFSPAPVMESVARQAAPAVVFLPRQLRSISHVRQLCLLRQGQSRVISHPHQLCRWRVRCPALSRTSMWRRRSTTYTMVWSSSLSPLIFRDGGVC